MITISLCMIVKNEEDCLARCLDSVKDAVKEMIIVDTGSTDRTVEIAESFSAHVLHYEWTGDFAAARNVGLDAATGDYILVLDADEYLEDAAALQQDLISSAECYMLTLKNWLSDGTSYAHTAIRLFRNSPDRRFRDRLHESIEAAPFSTSRGSTLIHHEGYRKEIIAKKDKNRRNLAILNEYVDERTSSGNDLYNLAREFHVAKDYDRAAHYFELAYTRSRSESHMPALLLNYGMTLGEAGRISDGVRVMKGAVHAYPGYTELHFILGELYEKLGYAKDAEQCWKMCLSLGELPHEELSRYGLSFTGAGSSLPRVKLAEQALKKGAPVEAFDWLEPNLNDPSCFLGSLPSYLDLAHQVRIPLPDQFAFIQSMRRPANGKQVLEIIEVLFQEYSPLLALYLQNFDLHKILEIEARSKLCGGRFLEAAEDYGQLENPPFIDLFVLALLLKDSQVLLRHKEKFNYSQREWKAFSAVMEGKPADKSWPESLFPVLEQATDILSRINAHEAWNALTPYLEQGPWDIQFRTLELMTRIEPTGYGRNRLLELSKLKGIPDSFDGLLARLLVKEGASFEVEELWKRLKKTLKSLDYYTYSTLIDLFLLGKCKQLAREVAKSMSEHYVLSSWAHMQVN